MEIKEAQNKIDEAINQYGGYWKPHSMLARLIEEVGELARAININFGEKRKKHKEDGGELEEELADVLFTVLAIGNALNIDLNDKLEKVINKKLNRDKDLYKK